MRYWSVAISTFIAASVLAGCASDGGHGALPQCDLRDTVNRPAPAGTPARIGPGPGTVTSAAPEAVSITDRYLMDRVHVESIRAVRLDSLRAQVTVSYLNCTDYPMQIESRTQFLDGAGLPTESATEWQTITLSPRSRGVYQTQSVRKPDPEAFTVEIEDLMDWKALLIVPVLGMGIAEADEGQYREGQPDVLAAPPVPSEAFSREDRKRLATLYAGMDQPVVALLMGRGLERRTRDWDASERVRIGAEGERITRDGEDRKVSETVSARASATIQHEQSRRLPEDAARWDVQLADIEKGFNDVFADLGVRVMDYDTALRRQQRQNEIEGLHGRQDDLREIEIDALTSQADWLMEVESRHEGVAVRVIDLDSSVTLANMVFDPDPEEPQGFSAGSSGYEKTEAEVDYMLLGRRAALGALSAALE